MSRSPEAWRRDRTSRALACSRSPNDPISASLVASAAPMDWLRELFHRLTDVETLVRVGGLTAMTAIVFAETGLLVGFFLPGDSLLVTAGVFAAAGHLDIRTLLVSCTLAAIVGDQVGYWIGHRTGPHLFRREDSLLFKRAHLLRAKRFYERHGG